MNEYTRLIKFPKGWKLTIIERDFDSESHEEYWKATAHGPSGEDLTIAGGTKEDALKNLLYAVETLKYVH